MTAESIMVIGAHAFDAEVIAGPLVAAHTSRGARALNLHLSLGEQGHRSLAPAEYAEQKLEESTNAARLLRAGCATFNLPDAFIPVNDECALALCDLIRDFKPEVVVTHWRGSWHKDHQAAFTLTNQALFYAALPTLTRDHPSWSPALVLYGQNWEDAEDFRPDLFLDVSAGFETWQQAIACYELGRGELASFPYVDYYTSLYRLNGCISGYQYAQGFMTRSAQISSGVDQFRGGVNAGDGGTGHGAGRPASSSHSEHSARGGAGGAGKAARGGSGRSGGSRGSGTSGKPGGTGKSGRPVHGGRATP